ncbi:hypothetical protein A1704_08040 [Chryseobacterium cucumeris]|uniref:hypothetical protein n=1 Tax=Chryseobacterium cucumeris TaxID=1813611 RepID=UPI0007898DEE|nr:hypothetical protein [Chryseobacterium cucumeris]KYH06239.1 hypothetical protein A1704_08040 [Chryseobacterium cucumeris]
MKLLRGSKLRKAKKGWVDRILINNYKPQQCCGLGWFRSYHKNGKKYTEYKAHNNVEYNGTYKNHFIMKEEKIDKIIISLKDVKKMDYIIQMVPM